MNDAPETRQNWQFPELITPEALVERFAANGIIISERTLRDIARRLGAFRVIGKSMFFMPEDLEAILEDARPKPRGQQKSQASDLHSDLSSKRANMGSEARPLKPVYDEARKVFTPAMVAKRWGCSERHVRNLIESGKLPSFRLGGKLIRIRAVDVETVEKLLEDSHLAEADADASTTGQAAISTVQTAAKRPRAKRLDR
ncbi:helix-turn-helix domain-containing protein [Rhizobium sp. CC-YZS058]|uniref:helix-turn-helix domain-containing protein n=1 Tax=Rhizobium sp. CC-YZS058 TaxID=3042153 RepID=UPI002B054341|nr:helix-turn-helix domain-containing protein [Rhizobium sp. CC-YZS058]MEA3533248.1 helix-turn-helix domain-containing protein [Rhizobium sp. CC-YZS058]